MSDDRSLTGGIPIPNWMRSKTISGFDPSTLSPPAYDDDFIQIRFEPRKMENLAGENCSVKQGVNLSRPHGVDDGFHGLKSECASSVVACAQRILQGQPRYHRQRRNSKSLPSSPLVRSGSPGSPETRRRLVNRFFTLEENKETNGSTSSLFEEIARNPEIRAKSSIPETRSQAEILQPKPSEYREMNFWSPTSM